MAGCVHRNFSDDSMQSARASSTSGPPLSFGSSRHAKPCHRYGFSCVSIVGVIDPFPELQALLKNLHVTPQPEEAFSLAAAEKRWEGLLGAATDSSPLERAACGALLRYVEETHKGQVPALNPPSKFAAHSAMSIDPATRRALELTQSMSGNGQLTRA